MGLIAQNMKCEGPSLIILTAQNKRDGEVLGGCLCRTSCGKGKLFICERPEPEGGTETRCARQRLGNEKRVLASPPHSPQKWILFKNVLKKKSLGKAVFRF